MEYNSILFSIKFYLKWIHSFYSRHWIQRTGNDFYCIYYLHSRSLHNYSYSSVLKMILVFYFVNLKKYWQIYRTEFHQSYQFQQIYLTFYVISKNFLFYSIAIIADLVDQKLRWLLEMKIILLRLDLLTQCWYYCYPFQVNFQIFFLQLIQILYYSNLNLLNRCKIISQTHLSYLLVIFLWFFYNLEGYLILDSKGSFQILLLLAAIVD